MVKIIINWFLFLSFVGAIVALFVVQWERPLLSDHMATLPTMTGPQVIVFALSFAFLWVEVLKWWRRIRPFNCFKCMCGWSAVILAFTFHVEFWYMYLTLGLFVGAMFEGIKMRWL